MHSPISSTAINVSNVLNNANIITNTNNVTNLNNDVINSNVTNNNNVNSNNVNSNNINSNNVNSNNVNNTNNNFNIKSNTTLTFAFSTIELPISTTWLGLFWKILDSNFLLKVAQTFRDFCCGLVWNTSLLRKQWFC